MCFLGGEAQRHEICEVVFSLGMRPAIVQRIWSREGGIIVQASRPYRLLGCVLVCVFWTVSAVQGDANYVSQGPFVLPIPGPFIPSPTQVPGKEYTDDFDKNTVPALDPYQVIAWDGVGGVMDSFDYSGTGVPGVPGPPSVDEVNVDALANNRDALFHSVIANTSALLFSVTGDNNIYFESIVGGGGIWATPPQIDHHGVTDVDALEVWGPEAQDDSNRFSLTVDPGGTAIWAFTPPGGPSVPFVTTAQISAAIGLVIPPGYQLLNQVDVDGLMTFDENILFSIRPLDAAPIMPGPPIINLFDGGEIWVWNSVNPAVFLNHGGHLWNTAFNVKGTFGVQNENVNALEAVSTPEPGTVTLLCVGVLVMLAYGWHRRKRVA